jgi:hypothetical protein
MGRRVAKNGRNKAKNRPERPGNKGKQGKNRQLRIRERVSWLVNSHVGWVKLLISPELYPPEEIIIGGRLRAISFELQAGERERVGSSGTERRAWGVFFL